MVLTQLQTTAFFENPDQLGIPHETMVQIQREGIQAVADLADFEKQELQQLADNLRKPGGRIPDPNPNAAPGATIPTPAFTFGAKSQKRLTVACDLVRYYQTVGRDLTSANIQWNQVMSNFEIQWKALKEKKDEDDPDVPTITKALPIIKWTEAFQDFLHRVIGARMIPLAYVIRTNPQVPGTAPTLAPNQPHSTEHGSVEEELIARASHTHALFRDDNSVVYYHLEKATRGTSYAASIKPFTRAKDGRGAWKALTSQYAGKDKWEAEIKRQEQLLHTRIWKGQSNFSLENFISQHRNAYVSMQASAEHVQYQLPNQLSCKSELGEIKNYKVYSTILEGSETMEDVNESSRTELDSHANMPVIGRNAYILSKIGETVDVAPFTPDYKPISVELVDAALKYECPYSGEVKILIIRRGLHVPSMTHNLLPPFMLREAGIQINDVPKIHVTSPSEEHHAIIFQETNFRIPLTLHGTFSYFPTSKPTTQELEEPEDVYVLTPTTWNPHSDAYVINEESMLDWEGNMKHERDHEKRVVLEDIPSDDTMISSLALCEKEQMAISSYFVDQDEDINATYGFEDEHQLYHALNMRNEHGQFAMSIGATSVLDQPYLDDDDDSQSSEEDDISHDDPDDEFDLKELDDDTNEVLLDNFMASTAQAGKTRGVDPKHLAKIWRISHEDAQRTIDVTTQTSTRTDDPALSRNYSTNDRMLRYKRIKDYFFMDTFFATKKGGQSSRGHTCCQLFVTDKGFIYVVPMKKKSEVLLAIKQFAKEIGAPDSFVADMSGEQMSSEVKKFCNDIGTTLKALEEGTPWSNKAELYIGLIKEAVRKDMRESNSPLCLWDYCVERRARINNLTAKNAFKLHGSTPHTVTTGDEGDISNLCQYGWYEWCYFRDHTAAFPNNKEVLGRVLGPARGAGNEMAQWILKANGRVVPRRSLRPLKVDEIHSPVEIKKREVFDELIKRRWGTPMTPPNTQQPKAFEKYEDHEQKEQPTLEVEDIVDSTGKLINQQPAYDQIINAEVQLQLGEEMVNGKVIQRTIGPDGKVTGTYDNNPFLNSIIYDVEFPDGQVKEYAANIIAENMLTQVDSDGMSTTLMEAIVDHRRDDEKALQHHDKYVQTKNGRRHLRKTTKGWELLIKWKDKSESWIKLADMKESHPVEVAEYARARGIDKEPAFEWWVPHTLKKRQVILSALKKRIRKTTHKYGIEIPTSVEHAFELDRKNGNNLWKEALEMEMYNIGVAFEILEDGKTAPAGYTKVSGHLIWSVKMDFTRKARWVLDGHKTPDPVGSKYAGVVSRESVRIAFTYAALNDLDVCMADIRNAYLQSPTSQKHYIICGPEFGMENVGKVAIMHRAVYGGKTSGRDFRNHLRSCMEFINFTSCPADPDVWMRPAIKSDGTKCYDYVLLYVDDALVVSENAESILRNELGRYFELKEESIGPPDHYLGGKVRKVQLENGVYAWAFSSSQYVQTAVKNVEAYLDSQENKRWKMPSKADTPLTTTYRPELDVSRELNEVDAAYYQSLIGILRWMVELGRVDVCLEVSMMSSHLALPREGHLEQVLHIFAYLKKYHNTELVYDPSDPVVDENDFERRDWASSEFGHVEGKEEFPANMPEPRGHGFIMRAKVDADHASDTVSRRSRTGLLIYLNCALVYWWSKKQTSVESSSFGSEFVAMKQCCEYIRGLRYKLRMMGIPVEGPTYIYGDNQSVLANTTIPDSTLKKKSQSIAYHYVREGVARDEWRTSYVNTHDNEADLLTKQLPHGEKRKGFVCNLLHHIFGLSGSVMRK